MAYRLIADEIHEISEYIAQSGVTLGYVSRNWL